MPRPRRNPVDPGRHATRRRRIRTAYTNHLCPYRDQCLELHQNELVLDCTGCEHEHETISKSELSLDIEGAMRLLWALYVDDSTGRKPIELIQAHILEGRYSNPYHTIARPEIV